MLAMFEIFKKYHILYFIFHLTVCNVAIVSNQEYVSKACAELSLNGKWTAANGNKSIVIESTVPGNIYTDLMQAKVIGDPYYRNNDVSYKWIAQDNWTFNKTFQVECDLLQKKRVILVFHGLDTVGEIFVNGENVGSVNNMFVRYMFDVKTILKANNTIVIAFKSPVKYAEEQHEKQIQKYVIPPTCPPPIQKGECHVNYIRKTQSSFSWDWGPSFPSQGIWNDVEIVGFNTILIRDIVVSSEKIDNDIDGISFWTLHVLLHLDNADLNEKVLNLNFLLNNELLENKTVSFNPGKITGTIATDMEIPRTVNIKEWWPNGLGDQVLYTLKVVISSDDEIATKEIRVGFRTLELIQEPVTNSTGLSFYFRVNGVPFFAKGSNWIPADSFSNRITPEYTRLLLQSAKDANMNMMRVWGGGSYETDIFYSIADELGIFIWQDIMFACALYPTNAEFLNSVSIEVQQQVRHIQHHPSLLLWAGNNENEQALVQHWWPAVSQRYNQYKIDYLKLYIETIMPIVHQEDPSRIFLPSSPSNGKETESEGWISSDPLDYNYGDIHFYKYIGDLWNWKTYPRARFISEYGFQSHPSFEAYASVSNQSDWTYPSSDFLSHRQHHMFGDLELSTMISQYLISPGRSCGQAGFKDLLYLSQIIQAMSTKTETELYRRSMSTVINGNGKTMGALYWQFNDIWQGPSWSSIEYGGKWKILHYYAKNFFTEILVSPYVDGNQVKVMVVSDSTILRRNLILQVYVYNWDSFTPAYTDTVLFNQPPLLAQQVYVRNITGSNSLFDEASCSSIYKCFFYFTVIEPNNSTKVSSNFLLLTVFSKVQGLNSSVEVANVTGPIETKESTVSFKISLNATNIAAYVWLDTPGIPGRFSDNGFFMLNSSHSLYFHSFINIDSRNLTEKLTVRSLTDTCR